MDIYQVLTDLTNTPGVTGHEEPVSRVVESYYRKFTDRIERDPLGNVMAHMGDHGPRLIVCCHMDEVGMFVTKIEEDGMLRLRAAGGVDARILPGMEVVVHGKKPIPAVIGAVPPHLTKDTEPRAYTFPELLCDTGLSPLMVQELVAVGDCVTYNLIPPARLQNGRVSGKSFDDRSLIAVQLLTMEMLKDRQLNCQVAFVGTTQEEVGQWGALIATERYQADIGFAMDVTHSPSPGTVRYRTTPLELIDLSVGTNLHPRLYHWLRAICDREGLPYEVHSCVGATGTDAWRMQLQSGGIPVCLASLPLKYMHSAVEIIDLATLENCAKLLAAFILELDEHWEEKLCLDD